ncbi:hypothetical protein L596_020764 [Steinernema carpocapsae]|uniref:Uncharacterized protein n=1 Tax=Steinernema carpocapsae TaxID=34508 RepID=A0A4U5MUH7_STECR|nr:hypothetical protein L596_020764 [Steinernema carpocapsae]
MDIKGGRSTSRTSFTMDIKIFFLLLGLASVSLQQVPIGDCNTAPSLLTLYNGNMTIFYQSSHYYLLTNVGAQARNFYPFLLRIQRQIIMNNAVPVAQKIQQITTNITAYIGSNTNRANFLYNIPLISWGNYRQFTACGGA